MSQAKQQQHGSTNYDQLIEMLAEQASELDGGTDNYDNFGVVAENFVGESGDNERAVLAGIIQMSERGPHGSWDRHAFDENSSRGALRCLAASSLKSDLIQRH